MATHPHRAKLSGGPLNTLAQTGTTKGPLRVHKAVKVVEGNGTDVSNTEALKNRAKRKMISQKLVLALIDVATKKGEPERAQAYWNTYFCQYQITKTDTRIYGKYCKNRFCTLCSANRKATLINQYFAVVKKWSAPYFVTLTAKSVPAKSLKKRIADMNRGLRIIIERYKKRDQRGAGKKLMGIKALECNFNPVKRTYNPHIHLLVPDKETAEIIRNEWLKLCTKNFSERYLKLASPRAQKIRAVKDTERDLIEIVKYATKVFTDPVMKKKSGLTPFVYASALDNIICAMKGHRIFDRFGFNLNEAKQLKVSKRTTLEQYRELIFDPKLCDWVDPETEELLTNYQPPPALMAILESNIDTSLQ